MMRFMVKLSLGEGMWYASATNRPWENSAPRVHPRASSWVAFQVTVETLRERLHFRKGEGHKEEKDVGLALGSRVVLG